MEKNEQNETQTVKYAIIAASLAQNDASKIHHCSFFRKDS